MSGTRFVEYRVRPVTRYIVTRYENSDNGGGVSTVGEYDREDIAYAVCYAMCKQEHDKSGEPVDSMSFIYPGPIEIAPGTVKPAIAGNTFTPAAPVA